jgi:hypothetical protein
MAVWLIRLNTRWGGQCGEVRAVTKKECVAAAAERMPWLSKRHLAKECEKTEERVWQT